MIQNLIFSFLRKIKCKQQIASSSVRNFPTATNHEYNMPDKYRNAFYLANASFFDSTHWFVHRAYEVIFPSLVEELKCFQPTYDDNMATEKVKNIINILEFCTSIADIHFPIKKNQNWEMIRGFKVQHGTFYMMNGPCLGGLRIGPEVNRNQLKALSLLSTYKHACVGILLPGSHGGITIDPAEFSENEVKNIVQTYVTELSKRNFCGEHLDIIESDIGCGARELNWISDVDDKDLGNCVAGNCGLNGGVENHIIATSEGIFYGTNLVLNDKEIMTKYEMGEGWKDKTFILEGLGKIGIQVALLFEAAGAKCVGVKEWNCSLHNPDGIKINDIIQHRNKHGSILNFCTKVKPFEGDELLKTECDLLILAAKQKTLNCYVADKVQAKIIVEVANGAITPSAHKILMGRQKFVVPDVLINSSSTIVSCIEYLRNIQHVQKYSIWGGRSNVQYQKLSNKAFAIFPDLNKFDILSDSTSWNYCLEEILKEAFEDVFKISKAYNLDYDIRIAAYIRAAQNIFRHIITTKIR